MSPKTEAHVRPHSGQSTEESGLGILSFLACRLMSKLQSRLSSASAAPLWTWSLQALRSAASASHFWRGMLQSLRDTLRQSLKRFRGPPGRLTPDASSEYNIILGRCVSGIRTTWPAHRNRAFVTRATMLSIPARRRTSVLGTLSSQDMPRILQRERRWNCSSCFKCFL